MKRAGKLVGASGIEPPTTCVSSKCSTAELRAFWGILASFPISFSEYSLLE